jgi:glycerol-3-phosphate dehydrogenase
MSDLSTQSRQTHYSVLIIGAGINGCGTFRDLCLQGVDCLLIDRGDVCGGASAAPSRLIHGGIKYLETNEFRLVKESAMERNRLLRNAPHYVKAMEVLCPAHSWFGGLRDAVLGYVGFNARIKQRGALLIEIGLRIYDFYSRKVQALPNHRFYNKSQLREDFPDVTHDAVAAGLYHEGRVTHAERLGLELVLDGLEANPKSELRTYTQVAVRPTGNQIVLQDSLTSESWTVTADIIINAAGPWIDKVNDGLGIPSQYMGGSKGSHLIVKHQGLVNALQGRMMYFGCKDGRFNLIYPFFGNVLIGSTDHAVKDADAAHCSAEETDYMLGIVSEIFPAIKPTRNDVILTYCGVRPLPRANGKNIGDVSRDHSIGRDTLPDTAIPILSLIGGKWTTFRAFSEQTSNVVLSLLGQQRHIYTQDLAIGGGRNYPRDDKAREVMIGNLGVRGAELLDRYGTKAAAFAAPDHTALKSLPTYSHGELTYVCQNENVRRLADLLLRRTAITMEGLLSDAVILEAGTIAAHAMGWDEKRTAEEIAFAQTEMARRNVKNVKREKVA